MNPTVEQLQAVEAPKMTIPGLVTDHGAPRNYQLIDAAFCLLKKRVCVAEYPAAGKKLIAIIALLKAFSLMKAERALVVSLGIDVDQWEEEFNKFTEGVSVQVYRGPKALRKKMLAESVQPDVRICTYQTAGSDLRQLLGQHQIIILDEVSYLKNPDTDAAGKIRCLCAPSVAEQLRYFKLKHEQENPGFEFIPFDLPEPAECVWGLTATPMETGPMDIFSLFWALQGRASPLGTSPNRFKQGYCIVNKFAVRVPQHRNGRTTYKRIKLEKVTGAHPDALPHLKSSIKEEYIRHPWDTVAKELPELDVEPIWLEMGKKQRDRYLEICEGSVIFDYLKRDHGRQVTSKEVSHAVKRFYQLRCCDGLSSLPGQKSYDSIKLQKCMDMRMGELGGEKLIIYSRFHQPLDDLEYRFGENGLDWVRIDGNHSDEENTIARKSFMDKKGPETLLMTGKGAYALNLQIANYMIAFNTLYNPKKLDQLWGRMRRPKEDGGACIAYHLLCKDTAEESQWVILRERDQEFRDIFGAEEDFFDSLTPEEQEAVVSFGLGSKT